LESDVEKSTSGVFQQILLSILNNQRDSENVELDPKQVEFDAWLLTEAGEFLSCLFYFALLNEIFVAEGRKPQ
jgi:hypothetical protein